MICPDCETKYLCPCKICVTNNKSLWKRIERTEDGKDWKEVCPGCGKSESINWWMDEEYRQYKISLKTEMNL